MVYTRLFGLAVAAAALAAGVQAQGTTNLKACVPEGQFNAGANVDYFPEKSNLAQQDASSSISISYHNYYKVVKSLLSGANQTIVLWQCGTQRPADVVADRFISVPIDDVAIGDTTIVPYIEALGGRSTIKYSSAGQYTGSPCLQALNTTQSLDDTNEQTQIASVDTYFSFMDSANANATNYVSFAATTDPGALKRSQWIHFIGAFYNAEAIANTIYSQIADNYKCLSSAAKESAPSTPLTVAFASYSNYQGKSTWSLSTAPYVNDYITSIGAKNVSVTSGFFSEAGPFQQAIKDVDLLVDTSFGLSSQDDLLKAYGLTKDSDYKFIKNQKIFTVNKEQNLNGGMCKYLRSFYDRSAETYTDYTLSKIAWFESAVLEQNVVLADLIWAAYPNVQPNYQSTYLKNINDSTVKTLAPADCTDRNAPSAIPNITCPKPVKQGGGSTGGSSGAGSLVASSVGAIAAVAIGAAFAL
ncbi:hypothetical protein HK097_001503 [Rhizophlyctis rosea]|uniref:Uncharacterized protein n=1 Tax=Rhizophlyctis rosea TaxID=64517 RepID=A0AAD5XA33_9FUNG|nr:hypothetical protein HK097_001503 [Rhizophlyctis rosea]